MLSRWARVRATNSERRCAVAPAGAPAMAGRGDGLSLREAMAAASDDGDGDHRVRWFHEQARAQRQSQARLKQRAATRQDAGARLFRKGLAFIDNPHTALHAHQVPDLAAAHRMILDTAHSNLDVRRRPKILNKPREGSPAAEPDEPKAVKLPSLYEEGAALAALSDGIRDAMHRARILNEDRKRSESVFLPASCYGLEDIAPDDLHLMRLEMLQEEQQHRPKNSTLAVQKMSGRAANEEATGRGAAAGVNDTAARQLELAFKSATCHWCRQGRKWCGWCKIPEMIASRKGAYASEGLHSNERSPQKGPTGLLGGLGIGGKALSQTAKSDNPKMAQIKNPKGSLVIRRTRSAAIDPNTRSASSLGRLEGHSEYPAGKKKTAGPQRKPKKSKRELIDPAEELRKKVQQVLNEKKPISFSLLEDKDVEELSHRVIVRELEPGEVVIKYADNCSPALLHCPDTEDGQPVLAMGSPFFVVMHGILDVLTEYTEKGAPLYRGKMTRGCVFGEVLP